jgi:acyl-CoA synthetase (AMP-forming)/AMP-acid ligase II
MHPGIHGQSRPDQPAAVMADSGNILTHGQLDARSNQLAHLFRNAGLKVGDRVAIFMENHLAYFEVLWAALRSGLYLTTINRFLTAEETAYILTDSEAKALVTSPAMAGTAVAARRSRRSAGTPSSVGRADPRG